MSGSVEAAPHLHAVLRFAFAATVALLLLPATAAAGVRIEARDAVVPTARGLSSSWRVLPAQTAPYRFNMVGVHWRGAGRVFLRTSAANGGWSAWRDARPEAEDAPDPETPEARGSRGWTLGNPVWVGPADRIQLNVAGDVGRVRTFFIASPVERGKSVHRTASVERPGIILRRAWGADESIVREQPWYADRVAFSVVHHTAGAEPSSPEQSAAIVRGIQTYHVKGNGWNDIGYNFLVDRFGQVFEGRGGGIDRNVVGAHAEGFNTGSVGVATIGTFSGSSIASAGRRALVRLLAWRLDLAHVDPTSRLTWRSAGNPKYPAGKAVRLRAVSGHRDTGYTTCPGGALYSTLSSIGKSVRAYGGTKIFNPRANGSFGGPVRIRGRVVPAAPWTVRVVDGSGRTVATGSGSTSRIDWTWGSAGADPEIHRWIISAGDALEGTGLVGKGGAPPPAPGEKLRLRQSSASPRVLTPNGDGSKDTTRLGWRSSLAAELRILILDSGGARVGTAVPWTVVPPGSRAVGWSGLRAGGSPLEDGAYTLRFQARAGAQWSVLDSPLKVDRTLASFNASTSRFSPNGDKRRDTTELSFVLARRADVSLRLKPGGATLFDGRLGAGSHAIPWNGQADGSTVADGSYTATVSATTRFGTRRLNVSLVVDTRRPRVTNVAGKRTRRGTTVSYRLNEPGRVVVWFGGTRVETSGSAGGNRVWRRKRVSAVSVRSWDAAGNRSALRHAQVG
jgi:N-acetylmuramoyl-L-alanine amidase